MLILKPVLWIMLTSSWTFLMLFWYLSCLPGPGTRLNKYMTMSLQEQGFSGTTVANRSPTPWTCWAARRWQVICRFSPSIFLLVFHWQIEHDAGLRISLWVKLWKAGVQQQAYPNDLEKSIFLWDILHQIESAVLDITSWGEPQSAFIPISRVENLSWPLEVIISLKSGILLFWL